MQEEIWKDIKGYEGLYQVSNLGKIKSITHKVLAKDGTIRTPIGKLLKPTTNNSGGYLRVSLSKNNIIKNQSIHRLVANAFIPNPNNLPQINHIDGNKQNNCVRNLEWCTCEDNIKHAWEKGLNYVSDKHKKVASQTAKKRWEEYRRRKIEE